MQSRRIQSLVLVLILHLVGHDELSVVDLFHNCVDFLARGRDSVILAASGDDPH